MKLLTLEEWARRRYETPPSNKTLLRWVRDFKILPRPRKEGRAYLVVESAVYVDTRNPEYQAVIAEHYGSSPQ